MIIKLEYFSTQTICLDSYKNKRKTDLVNLNFIISISELKRFINPPTAEYATITMINNDKYYIDKESFLKLSETVEKTLLIK